MTRTYLSLRNVFTVLAFVATLFITKNDALLAKEVDCSNAVPVDLNSTFRGDGIDKENSQWIKLELPSAGIVTLDISTEAGADVFPKLGIVKDRCGGLNSKKRDLVVIDQSATQLIFAARTAGSYHFRMAAQDRRWSLGRYKLTTRFAEGFLTKTEPEEESDPDPLTILEPEEESDPDPLTKTEPEEESDPDPLTTPSQLPVPPGENAGPKWHRMPLDSSTNINFRINEICQLTGGDDHNDTRTCGSSLGFGKSLTGEINNDWSDDDDVFLIYLEGLSSVRLRVTGMTDALMELYDASGHRLATGERMGEEADFQITSVLSPGQYSVRVAGSESTEGNYRIRAEELDW